MSPAWPTVKLVSVPADAPSVFELNDEGVLSSAVEGHFGLTVY